LRSVSGRKPCGRTPGSPPSRAASTASCGPCRRPSAGARSRRAPAHDGSRAGKPTSASASSMRPSRSEQLVEEHLPRGDRQQVLTATDQRDALGDVVHRVGQRVGRRPVGADQHRVGDLSPSRSAPRRGRGRRRPPRRPRGAQPQAGGPALGPVNGPAPRRVLELGGLDDRRALALPGAVPLAPRLELLGGAVVAVEVPASSSRRATAAYSAAAPTGGTGRARRRRRAARPGPGPRPSRARPTRAPRSWSAWSPRWRAPRRCPRCGTRSVPPWWRAWSQL
jgi:hypothetical protein